MEIFLDISYGFCNAECSWCLVPHFSDNLKINKFMSLEDIKNFILLNKLDKDIEINFSGLGESLINAEFFKMIDLLSKSFEMNRLISNFSVELSKLEIEKILYCFKTIVIEMGGFTKETRFNNMHIEKDCFFDNLNKAIRIINENPHLDDRLIVKILLNKINFDEVNSNKTNIHLESHKVIIHHDDFIKGITKDKSQEYFLKSNYKEEIRFYINKEEKNNPCTTEEFLRILPSGEIVLCCSAPRGIPVGNAFKESIKQITTSSAYLRAKESQKNRTYTKYCKYCIE
jgi:molybdenum cofactor biosynthesis enzyme MoaA